MPTDPLLINPSDPDLREKVDSLVPVPGYCIFIDVVGSTAMKQQGIRNWVALIHNAFANATTFLYEFRPLKGIGDELMYYIEEADLEGRSTPLQIYDGLYQTAIETENEFPPTKIVAAYCSDVYSMTFLPGTRDYYGIDIDRAARLKSIDPPPQPREVVIDSGLHDRVIEHYNRIGNSDQFESVRKLSGPTQHEGKGLNAPIEVYRATKA